MYNLAEFSLHDMTVCSATLRTLGAPASSFEDTANRLTRYLYDHLIDAQTGAPACALARFFKTHAYGDLPADCQVFAQNVLGAEPISSDMKCFVLTATAGERPEWNDRKHSRHYKAIPLVSATFVKQFPMFSQLFTQLGVNLDTTLQARSELLVDAQEHTFNVFYVPDAVGSPFVPVQQEFVIRCGVRSVLGFGGLLPSGDLFAVVLFSKVFLSRRTADLFKPLALSAKLALLPFDSCPMRDDVRDTTTDLTHARHRESQIAALEQLLTVQEEAVMTYATQREQAEAALQDSEARLSAVVHSTKDVVLFIDGRGMIKSWDDAAHKLFGYSVQEAYGQPGNMIITTGFDAALEQALRAAGTEPALQASGATCESVGRKKDGGTFPLELSLVSWKTQSTMFLLATIRDVTERKRIEAALEKSESRLRNVIDHAPDAIFTLSTEGLMTSLNPMFETITRWSRDEWIGRHFGLLVHPDDLTTAREIFAYILHNRCPVTSVLRIRSRDRGFLTGEFVGTPLIEKGRVVGLLGIARDITERKVIEHALRESEEQLRSVVQSTQDGIVSLDPQGAVVFWNHGAELMFGYPAEDMLNQPVTTIIPERFRERHLQGIRRATNADHVTGHRLESIGLRKDGTEFPIEFSLAAWKTQSGLFFTGIIRNITERKRTEDAINALVRGTASVTGEEFFPVFVRQLAAALDVSYAFVTEIVPGSGTKLRILASWEKTGWGETFEYESDNTPCGIVLRDGMAFYARDVQRAFPNDRHLIHLNISSYLAIAMVSSSGAVIGHVCVMDAHPLKNEQQATNIINIFAGRAAAELERLRATAALRQSEARQTLILNSLTIAFYTADASPDFRATWVSDNLERLTGFPARAFLDSPRFWLSRLHPDDRERVLADVTRGRDVGTVATEYRWQVADGSYRWYLDNAVYIRDAHGNPKELLGAWIDITHRKQAEEDVRRAEERYRSIFEHAAEGIFQTTWEGRYLTVNPALVRMYGYESSEEMMSSVTDIGRQLYVDPHRREEFVRLMEEQGAIIGFESQIRRKNLDIIWISENVRAIRDAAGRIVHFEGTVENVTARKQAEQALQESEERLRLSLSATQVGIWDWNIVTGLLVWSDTVAPMFGLPVHAAPLAYEAYVRLIHPDDRDGVLRAITRSVEEGAVYALEHRLVRPDGAVRWVACKGEVFRNAEAKAMRMLGTIQDVTERKHGDAELHSALTRLKMLSGRLEVIREEERGRIARELHDEFGVGLTCLKIDLSRLTGLIGPVAGLEKRAHIEEKLRSMGEFIDTTIAGVQRIVSELRPAILDDLGLVAAIEWQAQDFQRRTGITCTLHVNEEHFDIDSERATVVFRICQEALTNVARHAHATAVEIRLEERQKAVTLEITDNGRGIADEKIVDPRSLGLLGMRERAELFGGFVTIAGRREAGTAVTLYLRRSQVSPVMEGP